MSMYPIHICSLIIFELVLLMGLALNMFIITVISRDWYHSQCLPPCDLILLSEALTNIAIQMYSSLEYLFRIVLTEIYILEGFQKFLFIMYPLIVFSNFWITAWHCVFYCLKIANFSHPAFLRLKHMISDLVPWLILGTVVAALAVSFPIIWLLKEQYPKNSTTSALIMEGGIYSYNYFYVILMDSIGFSLPLGMIVTSALMILASLYKHAQRMQQNATSFSSPSLEAHKGAAKIILSLLAIYTCFYLALITAMADENGHRETPMFYVYKYIITLYPLMHALVILTGNPKLKAMATKTLWCCWY